MSLAINASVVSALQGLLLLGGEQGLAHELKSLFSNDRMWHARALAVSKAVGSRYTGLVYIACVICCFMGVPHMHRRGLKSMWALARHLKSGLSNANIPNHLQALVQLSNEYPEYDLSLLNLEDLEASHGGSGCDPLLPSAQRPRPNKCDGFKTALVWLVGLGCSVLTFGSVSNSALQIGPGWLLMGQWLAQHIGSHANITHNAHASTPQ